MCISCSYHWTTYTTSIGKKIKVKEYKTPEKEDMYKARSFFKYRYHETFYSQYAGKIVHSQTPDSASYIQFDTARIYLSKTAINYLPLFIEGVLYTQQFYCALDTSCKRTPDYLATTMSGERIINPIENAALNIISFEEPQYLKKSANRRRFKVEISAGSGFEVVFIELANDQVSKYVSIEEFSKAARLTFIGLAWGEI